MQNDYVVKVSRLIKVIVSHESAIIVGRGGNYILEDKREGIRAKLTAPFPIRAENIARLVSERVTTTFAKSSTVTVEEIEIWETPQFRVVYRPR